MSVRERAEFVAGRVVGAASGLQSALVESQDARRRRAAAPPASEALTSAHAPGRQIPLRVLTREAIKAPHRVHTEDRLDALGRSRASGDWSGWEDVRERGAAIRRESIAHMPQLLDALETKLAARGVRVHRCDTAQQARDQIAVIARDHGVRSVVKSKSMATEEIGLNEHLRSLGITVMESDLGEFIVQEAGQRPSHIVGPALHLSREDDRRILSESAGRELPDDAQAMASYARERLRQEYHDADMGVCGVNFAAADTGTLVVVSNEGNVDFCTSQPELLVAVMTVEKVVPRLADIGTLVPLLNWAANKEFSSVYQTLLSGPRIEGELDGPAEMHLVIVDNGRLEQRGTSQEEILACIRCGNCQFSCPVYRAMGGGHAYGSVYSGPVGAVLSAALDEPDSDPKLPFLCSLCGACAPACPVKIPLPDLLLDLRERYADSHTSVEDAVWPVWSAAWGTSVGFAATQAGAKVAGLVPDGVLDKLPVARDWAAGRALPPLKRAGRVRKEINDER